MLEELLHSSLLPLMVHVIIRQAILRELWGEREQAVHYSK